ncbi:MAG: Holliday junction resolvase RuvX, partial [Woeseiaceae bacterium]|nr:Holliday junction resolvase RuvX [Woeseiaceae bacterium]
MSQPRTILAFDFGLRRIGVAIGQDVTSSASPLGVVSNRNESVDHAAIAAIIKEWRPTGIVVGMPSHADGSPSEMQKPVESFIKELRRYELDIDTVDER